MQIDLPAHARDRLETLARGNGIEAQALASMLLREMLARPEAEMREILRRLAEPSSGTGVSFREPA
jgi:hypothetical protein